MKPEEIKNLLLRSLTDEISENERLILEREALTDHKFSAGFRERLMSKIVAGKLIISSRRDMLRSFDRIFVRIALTGVAAILLLALSIFISQGSLSYDALLGIDDHVDDALLSLLVE